MVASLDWLFATALFVPLGTGYLYHVIIHLHDPEVPKNVLESHTSVVSNVTDTLVHAVS